MNHGNPRTYNSSGLLRDENEDHCGLDIRGLGPADGRQLLSMFGLTEDGKLAAFLFIAGLVYFGIGFVGGLVHDLHRDKRTKAGKE